MKTYVVKRLEQAKLLTDPFKLRLIEEFAGIPATTKQVADRMGEKAPRLYRHVDALVDEGLLELVEEKPKRGTIERYYKTVAERFEVDPELFSPASGHGDDAMDMVRSLFRDTESDLVRLFNETGDDEAKAEETPIVMKFSIRGTEDDIAGLRSRLDEWIRESEILAEDGTEKVGSSSYSGMLAFYRRPDNG
jgi:predicted ArsR family transcriptional regulator